MTDVFSQVAGISASHLSLFIRTVLIVIAAAWSAWMIMGAVKQLHEPHVVFDFSDFSGRIIRVGVIFSAFIILITLST